MFVGNRSAFHEIVSWNCLLSNECEVLPPTAVKQLSASNKWSEPVAASFFACKIPLVSAWFLWEMSVTVPSLLTLVMCCSFKPLSALCEKMAEVPSVDLPHSPQGSLLTNTTPTSSVPLAGMVIYCCSTRQLSQICDACVLGILGLR